MAAQRVIIIGAGLGGLQCGYVLAKNGYDVTVLEQGLQIGGCLQTYRRGNAVFDTGFHYVGGLGKGESLEWLLKYYGLDSLPWVELDRNCVDRIVIGDNSYSLSAGHGNFVDTLSASFPAEREGLLRYVSRLKSIGDTIKSNFGTGETMPLFGMSAYDFLCECISDPLLRRVLSGASLRLKYDRDTLPLYIFAQINNSFIQSGWRLKGGGSVIAESLSEGIKAFGGKVITRSRVELLKETDGRITCAVDGNGNLHQGDIFISDIHPSATLALIPEGGSIKKVYRKRISALRNSKGVFTVNAVIKPGTLPYVNSNIYLHSEDADVWTDKGRSLMISYSVPDGGKYATNIDLLSYLDFTELEKWSDGKPMFRGEEYETFKRAYAEDCIRFAEKAVPGLSGAIERYYTSTSLTYRDYTATPHGSAFGIMKDWRSPLTTVLSPRTPVENLLLTGQNLNLHGVLGVSMTSLYTCAQILGLDKIKKEFGI